MLRNPSYIVLRFALLFAAFGYFNSVAQVNVPVIQNDPIVEMMDSLMHARFFESTGYTTDTAVLNIRNYPKDHVPVFNDLVYEARLAKLDAHSPFDLIYNPIVRSYIDLYAVRKREVVSRMLGLSQMYFPMFEQALDKFDLPLELKYLAIVESALNPNAVSRSGATGLWQFMYATGKMYGLNVTSYYDERRDPIKATQAACRYFEDLYKMFGDWQMVLAAYNGGPGTLNKAIRRSGGKKTYWEVRPYLPLETQGYVPAFIAVNYVMNYTAEHNLYPLAPKKEYFITDTVKVRQNVSFAQISNVLCIPVEDLSYLNPAYKQQLIPFDGDKRPWICLPANKVSAFINKESEIYSYMTPEQRRDSLLLSQETEIKVTTKTYVVKKGESVFGIARKFNMTAAELKKLNKMRNNSVHPGRKLLVQVETVVPVKVKKPAEQISKQSQGSLAKNEKASKDSVNKESSSKNEVTLTEKQMTAAKAAEDKKNKVIFYTVQPGDTLWIIANRYNGVTVDQLKKLNGISNSKSLKVGSKIKVMLES